MYMYMPFAINDLARHHVWHAYPKPVVDTTNLTQAYKRGVERVLHAEREVLSESEMAQVCVVFTHLTQGYADLAGGGAVVLARPQQYL
jgi:hypothetical protein